MAITLLTVILQRVKVCITCRYPQQGEIFNFIRRNKNESSKTIIKRKNKENKKDASYNLNVERRHVVGVRGANNYRHASL